MIFARTAKKLCLPSRVYDALIALGLLSYYLLDFKKGRVPNIERRLFWEHMVSGAIKSGADF